MVLLLQKLFSFIVFPANLDGCSYTKVPSPPFCLSEFPKFPKFPVSGVWTQKDEMDPLSTYKGLPVERDLLAHLSQSRGKRALLSIVPNIHLKRKKPLAGCACHAASPPFRVVSFDANH